MFRVEHINFLARLTLGHPAVCPRAIWILDVKPEQKVYVYVPCFSWKTRKSRWAGKSTLLANTGQDWTFRELWAPLVHTNFGGNSHGPIIGPYLFLGKFRWTNDPESSSRVSPYTGIGPWMAIPRWVSFSAFCPFIVFAGAQLDSQGCIQLFCGCSLSLQLELSTCSWSLLLAVELLACSGYMCRWAPKQTASREAQLSASKLNCK